MRNDLFNIYEKIHPSPYIGVGAKEILELLASQIDARFNLCSGERVAGMILDGTDGISGGVSLFINK